MSVLIVRIDLRSQVNLSFVCDVHCSVLGQSDILDLFIFFFLSLIIFDSLLILEGLVWVELLDNFALILPLEYLDLLDTYL